jgi:adenylate cyclase class IV
MGQEIEAKFRLGDPQAVRQGLEQLGAERVEAVSETNLILDTSTRELLGRGCGLRVRVAEVLDTAGAGRATESSRSPAPHGADKLHELPAAGGQRRVTLTYKGARDAELHARGIRAREEIETDVTDEKSLLEVLARLGFAPVLEYEKRRETWRLPESAMGIAANGMLTRSTAKACHPPATACHPAAKACHPPGEVEIVLDELPQLGWFVEIEAPSAERLEAVCQLLRLDPASATRETYPELAARHGVVDSDGARSLRF